MLKTRDNKILCIGEVLWDRFPSGAKPGGAPMNVAIHLNAMGQHVSIASRVGNDAPGKELKLFLEKSGLDTGLIQKDGKLPTGEVLIHLDETNNATYKIIEPVAWDNLSLNDDLTEKAKNSDFLIYGSLASRNPVSRNTILNLLDSDTIKLMDVNFRKPYDRKEVVEILLQKADIVKLNEEELTVVGDWYNKNILEEKSLVIWFADRFNLQIVCVTRGESGALLYYEGKFYHHQGYKIQTADTVGAGDAFLAGLIASFLDGRQPREALAFACAAGAFVASKKGATPTYDMDEIKKIQNTLH